MLVVISEQASYKEHRWMQLQTATHPVLKLNNCSTKIAGGRHL